MGSEGSAAYEEEELLSSGTMAPRPHPPGHTPSENKLSEVQHAVMIITSW